MMQIKLPLRTKAILTGAAVALSSGVAFFAAGATPAVAQTSVQSAQSQNWAGYVVSGQNFSSVSGSWTVPTVSASSSSDPSYSAVWVGLGGSGSSSSSSLEQIGTGEDYVNGQAEYYAWYELLPAGQVRLNLPISAGDKISARVSVSGTTVTLSLTDQTTGQSTTKTFQMSKPDTSSAEWIVEAPATQTVDGSLQILPLADFSQVNFKSATATSGGHTGGISDSDWSTTQVQLNGQSGLGSGPGFVSGDSQSSSGQSGSGATTSSLSGDGFSVSYQTSSNNQPAASQSQGSADPYAYGGGYGPGSSYGGGGYDPGYSYGDGGYGAGYYYGGGLALASG